jgi:ribosome-associated protein
MQDTAAKKDTAKLQRTIIDALEDVKAQDIVVFDTEHLSALFERVIIASGTSNRQTKALASSVRDAVREAGFGKPRVEGEDNGEWIIVDCHQCVVHVMQPAIRTYYHLEEIWGDTPIRLKLGAPKPAVAARAPEPVAAKGKKPAAKKVAAKAGSKPGAKRKPAKVEPVFAPPRPELSPPTKAKTAALKRPAAAAPVPAKTAAKSAAAKPLAKKAASAKLPLTVVGKAPAKKAAAKSAAPMTSKTAPAKRSRA